MMSMDPGSLRDYRLEAMASPSGGTYRFAYVFSLPSPGGRADAVRALKTRLSCRPALVRELRALWIATGVPGAGETVVRARVPEAGERPVSSAWLLVEESGRSHVSAYAMSRIAKAVSCVLAALGSGEDAGTALMEASSSMPKGVSVHLLPAAVLCADRDFSLPVLDGKGVVS